MNKLSLAVVAVSLLVALFFYTDNSPSLSSPSSSSSPKTTFLSPSHGVYNVTCAPRKDEDKHKGGEKEEEKGNGESERERGTCRPSGTNCGRVIFENFASPEEVSLLRSLADSGMNIGPGGDGPPTILDLQSGAVSYKSQFIDVYRAMETRGKRFNFKQVETFRRVKDRIKQKISDTFGASSLSLSLTSPMFFSRISGEKEAITMNDQYWHDHIDELQYGSFDFTGLLYLNSYEEEYEGGTFSFNDGREREMVIKPRAGLLSLFTSGHENIHRVNKVLSGTRYALTIAFTCDPSKGVGDFLPKMTDSLMEGREE